MAEILEAECVFTQGKTFEEARENLVEVIDLMLEEAPHQFGRRRRRPPPGSMTETLFLVLGTA